jgi:hypothetical protein
MSKLPWIVVLATLIAVTAAAAEGPIPDLRGTWKGDSESIVLGGGNLHHVPTQTSEPELRTISFTLTVDKQDGRRFSGTFSSSRGGAKAIGVIARSGTIYMLDAEGYTNGSMLAPNQMELCYLKQSPDARIASCVDLTKLP